jgi:hypothetical protein
VLCQLSYAPRFEEAIVVAAFPVTVAAMAPPRRPSLGVLFLFLAAAFAGVAYAAARAAQDRPGLWSVVAGAAALALWLATLALRALR